MYIKKEEKSQINNLNFPIKNLGEKRAEETKSKQKEGKNKEQKSIKQTEKQQRKINKTKHQFFEKIKEIDKSIAWLTKKKIEGGYKLPISGTHPGISLQTLKT